MKNQQLSERQQEALQIIDTMLAQGETPSLGSIAKAMRVSRGTVQKFIIALRDANALETPQLVGEWKVTRSGRKAIVSS